MNKLVIIYYPIFTKLIQYLDIHEGSVPLESQIDFIYLSHVLYIDNIDTLFDDADIENRDSTFTFAPGEGQQPLSIFQDKDSECSLSDPLSDSFKTCCLVENYGRQGAGLIWVK